MKTKTLWICLIWVILMTFFLAISPAMANSWNLPSGLILLFSADHAYDDYHRAASDAQTADYKPTELAVFEMISKDHTELFVAVQAGKEWKIACQSTEALYQPGQDNVEKCSIEKLSSMSFLLSYPGESYTFELNYDGWILTAAQFAGGCSMQIRDDYYTYIYTNGTETAPWITRPIPVEKFSISQQPKTIDAVKHLNTVQEISRSAFYLNHSASVNGPKNVPVYTAPSKIAYRAANDKAAISLSDEFWTLGTQDNWCLVRYKIDNKTAHYGYINYPDFVEPALLFTRKMVTLEKDTFITDDPWLSQRPITTLTQGSGVNFLAVYEPYYAYVETQINGKTARGFIPMTSIASDIDTEGGTIPELLGYWKVWAGGTMYAEAIRFNADGTCLGYFPTDGDPEKLYVGRQGRWYVAPYDASYNRFWNDPPYMITFVDDNSLVRRYGLVLELEDNKFSLTDTEGGGGFEFISE